MSDGTAQRWQNRIVGEGFEDADQLLASPWNWRIHPKAQQTALKAALDSVGWVQRVIVNRQTGHVVDGHLRAALAISAGEQVPVLYVDLTEDEERLVLATLDPVAAMAAANREMLSDLLADLRTTEIVQDDAGLRELLGAVAGEAGVPFGDEPTPDPGAQMDRAAELRDKWGTERGQVWEIASASVPGKAHRIMCGDSTGAADVARLMGDERAQAIITDPPYGQNQDGVPHDDPRELDQIVSGAIEVLPIDDGIMVAFQSPRTFTKWLDYSRQKGFDFERVLWLYKAAQCTFPWRGWLLKSEAILVFSRGNAQWQDVHPYAHDCYYLPEVSGELGENSGWHGSIKPLNVVIDLMRRISSESNTVFDGFLGSGTTAIAAEQTGRVCYGMEIDSGYTAVALQRLADMGLTPVQVDA